MYRAISITIQRGTVGRVGGRCGFSVSICGDAVCVWLGNCDDGAKKRKTISKRRRGERLGRRYLRERRRSGVEEIIVRTDGRCYRGAA